MFLLNLLKCISVFRIKPINLIKSHTPKLGDIYWYKVVGTENMIRERVWNKKRTVEFQNSMKYIKQGMYYR